MPNSVSSPEAFLFDHVLACAERRMWPSPKLSPAELEQREFRHVDGTSMGEANVRSLPRPCNSALIGTHAIYVGSIGEVEDEAEQFLYDHHLRAARARSWLSTKENLYIFLAGPPGSGERGRTAWKNIAYAFERDERICRKMVWLPCADPSGWEDEVDRFCDRTFLAQPWNIEVAIGELDPVGAILTSSDLPPGWRSVLESPPASDQDLLDELLKVLEK
jgi:hypothetical protein